MARRDYRVPEWANRICLALLSVHPQGMAPKVLQAATRLTDRQIVVAVRWLRDHYPDEPRPPVVYLRQGVKTETMDIPGNHYYLAPSWHDHIRPSMRSDYVKQAAERLASVMKLLEQTLPNFPTQARRIKKVKRSAEYLSEELADLVADLAA